MTLRKSILSDGSCKGLPISIRLWMRVKKTKKCWLWIGVKNKDGYGFITYKRKSVQVHRISWMLHNNAFPKKLVLHKCDVRNCVRPSHLFLGTQTDNAKDMWKKKRAYLGGSLNVSQVRLARKLWKEKNSQLQIEKILGLKTGQGIICRLLNGKTYKWIKERAV